MIQELFSDSEKFSMGRFITFFLTIFASGMWVYIKVSNSEFTSNDVELIKWTYIAAVGNKVGSKFGEKKK